MERRASLGRSVQLRIGTTTNRDCRSCVSCVRGDRPLAVPSCPQGNTNIRLTASNLRWPVQTRRGHRKLRVFLLKAFSKDKRRRGRHRLGGRRRVPRHRHNRDAKNQPFALGHPLGTRVHDGRADMPEVPSPYFELEQVDPLYLMMFPDPPPLI